LRLLVILCLTSFVQDAFGQSKVNITSVTPSSVHVCADASWLEIDVRNITTSTLSGLTAEVILPTGMKYVTSSITGTGVTEANVSNPQKPLFDLPTLKLANSVSFKIKITAGCDIISFLANGGLAQAKVEVFYSGGKTTHNTTPLTIYQPSVKITSVTNQFATADLNTVLVRSITITNGGKGKIEQVNFQQVNQKGLNITGYSGGSTSTSGDTIWSDFTQSNISKVGNKDGYLDQNETLTIYDTILVSSCNDLKSYYSLKWGCDGSICETDYASATVTISTKTPTLAFTPKSSTTICFANSNKHLQELEIKNTGNDTARNILIDLFQGVNTGFYQYELSAIDEADITLKIGSGSFKKVTPKSKTYTYTGGGYSCLGGGAVGAVLLDLPNLPPGGTAHIKWYSISCCTDACNLNFYAHRWKYKSAYDNQCGNTINSVEAFGSYGYYQGFSMSEYTPSDVVNNQSIQLTFNISTASLLAPTSNAEMTVHLKLPAGLTHSGNAADFMIENDNNQSWQPNSVYQKNDTVFAIFRGAPKLTLARSELKIKLKGDCSKSSTNSESAYGLDLWYNPNPSCNDACSYLLYCFSSTIRVHCDKACTSGFKFSEFDAQRITYGEPDNNNDGEPDASGSLDMDKIKLERVMMGDTLQTTFRGRVNRVGSTTQFRYLRAASVIDRGYYMKVADVRLKIYRSGSLLYNCNAIGHTYSTTGYVRTFTFDVGISALISAKCPLYSGFLYGTKDSVELVVKYVYDINPGGVITEVNLTNEMYLSTVANPSSSQRFQCDTFGGKFVMVGSYYSNYGKGTYSTNSCNQFEVYQGYYLSVGSCCSNYAGNNIFPYEYRNWAQLDEAAIILPDGFDIVDARFYQYRTTGTGKTAYQYTDKLKPAYYSGDTAVYDVKSLYKASGGSLLPSDDGFHGYFYYKLQANCAAAQGKSEINYQFMMSRKNYFGNTIDTLTSASNVADDVVYEKPDVRLIAEQNNIKAKSDTAVWNVRISNNSYISQAEYIWLSYRKNGNTRVTQIKDRKTGKVVTPKNDIFRFGALPASRTWELEISAVFDDCDKDSFELVSGFNCNGYPDSLAQFPCAPVSLWLSYTPINSRLSAALNDSLVNVNLCQSVPYEVNITNEGEARIYDIYLDLSLRQGMILGDTAWGFNPGTNDSFAVVGYLALGNNIYRYDIGKFSSTLNSTGLPGFSSGLANELKFKFLLETNCDFVSSSYFLLKPGGVLRCGKPVITSYGIGKPINITGVKKPYFSSFTMEMKALDVCNFDGKMKLKFINLGPDTTSPKDKIQLLLPQGLYVDTSYLNTYYNGPTGGVVITNNGQYKAEWSLPDKTIPGDSSYFEIKTYVIPSEINCGYTQIIGQAVVKQPALCVKDSSWCNIDVATSSDLILDSIHKSDYTLAFNSAISYPSGKQELASLSYTVTNKGSIKVNGTLLQIKYVDDKNGNFRQDAGEKVVYADSIWQEIDRDSSVSMSSSFLLDPVQTCRLILLIDSTNCVCDASSLAIPPIRIVNAGRDTSACSLTDIAIGTNPLPGSIYKWTPTNGIAEPDSSRTLFNYINLNTKNGPYRRVLATTKGSCTTYDTVVIILFPAMQLDLPSDYPLCKSDSVIIGNIVKGGNGFKSYQWSPTNGISKPNSLKVWAKPQFSTLYTIQITDGSGCVLTDSTQVNVVDRPRADFVVKDTCVTELFTFTDASTWASSLADSVHWDFGNVGTSNALNPSIFIDSAQTLNVRYYIQDSVGCKHDTIKSVVAYPLPNPSFSPHDDCEMDTSYIKNNSNIEYGTYTSDWDVDGSNFNTVDLLYTYSSAGEYEVKLNTVSDRGCVSSLVDTLTIFKKPDIAISVDDVCLGDTAFFSYSNSNGNDSITSAIWDVAGTIVNDVKLNWTVMAATGVYPFGIEVETINGCRDTSSYSHEVHSIPKANFSVEDVCINDSSLVVSNSSLVKGNVSQLSYDVGFGLFVDDDSVSHQFDAPGVYTITHVVLSDAGCSDTISKTTEIHYREIPNLSVTGNCAEERIDLLFKPQNADSVNTVKWVLNNTDTVYGSNANTSFNAPGIQQVKLMLTTNWSCSSDTNFTIFVDPKPIANYTTTLPCSDNYVQYENTSTTLTGSISRNTWNLGDGNVSGNVDVNHTYVNTGTFPIQLIVENTFGCLDTTTSTTDISNIVIPDFDFIPACELDSASFTHTTTGLPLPAFFSFKLGNGSEVLNKTAFKYAYQNDGTYSVTLTVSTSANCVYDTIKQIEIYPLPLPGFDIDPPVTDILNSDVQVIDRSSGAAVYFYWLSDGNSYDTPGFTHHFNDSGAYVIRQILTSDKGCVDSFERYMTIGYLVNILIPNAFSPKSDNLNETFGPGGLGVVDYDLTIYNRWGEKIYQTNNGQPWDGKDAFLGVYYYALKMIDYKGKIHYAYGEVLLNR